MPNPTVRATVLVMVATLMELTVNSVPTQAADSPTERAQRFLAEHLERVRPLEIAAQRAWWSANVTGKESDFQAKEDAQNALDAVLADPVRFAVLKELDSTSLADRTLARTIHVLFLQYLEKQVDPALLRRITAKANAVEKAFNTFRARVDGQEFTDSQVRKILKTSKDPSEREKVWKASKVVGRQVEADLKALVALRNEAARKLGYPNFHAMMLALNEQSSEEVVKLFDDLDTLTREPFLAAKREIDARLSADLGRSGRVEAWFYHDPFFQEAPALGSVDLDAPYAKADVMKLCREFYAGIGLPIDDVLARSDLYEKVGKSPHAFCIDIDREGDVRVLANAVPNEYWAGTMLHELGHAVYSSKNIPADLPYPLRSEAHILTTEGVAMLFERFSKDADWLAAMGVPPSDPKGYDVAGAVARRNRLLIFSRWCQVMLRFEKSMYEDPGQDLAALWWSLVEKYQGVPRPQGRDEPDYASKIHVVSAPAYYHNYMMGELFAAQVHATICREVLGGVDPLAASYVGKPEVGRFMRKAVFDRGRLMKWNDLTRSATGEPLNPRAFAAEFQAR